MAEITDNLTYIDLTKLSNYNQTLNISTDFSFEVIKSNILGVFATYTILQWFLSFIVFITLFLILKEVLQNDFLTDIQLLTLTSFVVISMNILLLFYEIFTITAPLQFFFLLWIIGLISIAFKK